MTILHRSPFRKFVAVPACLSALVGLAACGAGPEAEQQAAPGYPRTIDNCGQVTRVEEPPKRVVSLNQGSTEILLSLGLGDRLAGTATWTDPILPKLEEEGADIPRLAENAPSFETVLDVEPDMVTASFQSTLGVGGVATRKQFRDLGVASYLSPTDCIGKDNSGDGDGIRTEPLTMDMLYGEIRDLAKIFDVEQRGEELVADLKQRLRKVRETTASDVSVMYWFANSEAPYMAGCCGSPGIITDTVGTKNAFDDTKGEWPQVNWETVAERNPDVIVLGDLTRRSQTAESGKAKIDFLESHPVTKNLPAVKNERFVQLSGQALNPSIRMVAGAEKLAGKLREFGLAD
ncbi:ABC transporter substrate-binding protein [Prauserella alba]|uniref:ABC transporter substrate-binding protein n=1 Tax=Prauserella alba TaxID=176898 RepID=A0ABN1VRP9_9PSEU|nr:ABC transporter substrate-binding protein [Prauserella alba]MCP2183788.1 iron complex transport system substrate-binding protein [Prauserella alba]